MNVRLGGFFRVIITKSNGDVRSDTGWFKNLITNQGLDWFGVYPAGVGSTMTSFAFVGTGNTTPSYTDTTMTANVTPAATPTSSTVSYVAGPPSYYSRIFTYQWAQGAIVANLAEVGIGSLTSLTQPYTGTPILYSHALIVDANGNPTTLSVTATDTLSVSYEARLYLTTTDTNYSLIIAGTTYSGIYRLSNIATPSFNMGKLSSTFSGSLPAVQYFSGPIGPITGLPSGPGPSGNPTQISWVFGTYTVGSYTIQATSNIPANSQGAINITAITIQTALGMWQYSVAPSWNRLATQNISTTWAISWSRF
jgi:hypothetical protein